MGRKSNRPIDKQITDVGYVKKNVTGVVLMLGLPEMTTYDVSDEGCDVMWQMVNDSDYDLSEEVFTALREIMKPAVQQVFEHLKKEGFVFQERKEEEPKVISETPTSVDPDEILASIREKIRSGEITIDWDDDDDMSDEAKAFYEEQERELREKV